MVPAVRFAVLVTLPLMLVGRLSDCARGGDLFPSLGRLFDGPAAVRQASHAAEVDLIPDNGSADDEGLPGGEPEAAKVFPFPAGSAVSPENNMPPVSDVPWHAEPGTVLYPMAPQEVWDDHGWSPSYPGPFTHQPLRQHLRRVYGPPQGRHRGLGEPMTNESWMFRPYSAGWLMGAMFGSPLIDDWVGISSGYFTGFRFGWDQNYYWGLEMQFAYGQMGLWDSARSKGELRDWYVSEGIFTNPNNPALTRLIDTRRDMELYQWAISAMYYPWGDARWRPYLSVGIGASRMKFTDIFLVHYDTTCFVFPLAVGVKYHWNDWLALRVECSENLSIPGGGGLKAVHNVSINGALEIRFGGPRTAYWPWNPGRTYW